MFKIHKNEPKFYSDAKRKVKSPLVSSAWYEIGKNEDTFKAELREHILLKEQNMLCSYCEREIESDINSSNTDHFKTRSLFPRDTLNYNNLLISCKSPYHCEKIKDNFGLISSDYIKIINPVFEDSDNFFDYSMNGDILVKDGLNRIDKEKAEFTIKIFELNNSSLQKDRAKIGESLKNYYDYAYEIEDILDDISSYPSFIKNIYEKIGELSD